MSARKEPYVPTSPHELIGYLGSLVEHAAADHPDDVALTDGAATYKAWRIAQGWDKPATGSDR